MNDAALRRRLADELRDRGAIRSSLLHDAFAAVSRHVFVPAYYRTADGRTQLREIDETDLDAVYRDRTLVTRLDGSGAPSSSSTAPSTMAFMLEALDLRPGIRVLEIGCGTGYNAALIHMVSGCEVVTVDPEPALVAAARQALRRHGLTGVRCEVADGYAAVAGPQPYDRVIVTCAVAGIPPAWLELCTPQVRIVAPLAHGGVDMLVRIDDGLVRPLGGAGYFILADGPLYPADRRPPQQPFGPAALVRTAPVPGFRSGYHDLWFSAAVADPRVTSVALAGSDPSSGHCGLVDGDSAAVARTDGSIAATGPDAAGVADALSALVAQWIAAGRPKAASWYAPLSLAPVPGAPLLTAAEWRPRPAMSAGNRW